MSRSSRSCIWMLVGLLVGCYPASEPAGPVSAPPPPPSGGALPAEGQERVIVTFQTSMGSFDVELFRTEAPKTVANFLAYVEDGFYANTIFHRVEKGVYNLAGGFDTEGEKKEPIADPVPSEADNKLTNAEGTVAMARALDDPNSATSQLIFNLADNANLFDKRSDDPVFAGYTVFARVVDDPDEVLDIINQATTRNRDGFMDRPEPDIVIKSVTVTSEPGAPVIEQGESFELTVDEDSEANLATLAATGEDPNSFAWSIETEPGNGTASTSGTGGSVDVSYTPEADYSGEDSFVVTVTDVGGRTSSITIEVTVVDAPDIDVEEGTRTFPVLKNTTGNALPLTASGGGDTEGYVWSIATQSTSGTAEISGDAGSAEFTYSPNADFFGSDSVGVQVTDTDGRSDTITIEITVVDIPEGDVRVRFTIADFGEFVVELFPDVTPITVANFLQYVDEGFYNGNVWHRVVVDFVIQTGNWREEDGVLIQDEVKDSIPNEADGAPSNLRGTISMALRSGMADSGNAQFFINVADNTSLDWNGSFGHTVFGEVVEGMDVVDAISQVPTEEKPIELGGTFQDVPVDPVVITEIVRE